MQTTDVASARQLAAQLAAFVETAMRTAQAEFFGVMEEFDLSISQLKILLILGAETDEPTPSQLTRRLGLSYAATGRAVDVLVRHGLAARREDPDDRRVKRLSLTEQGRATVNRIGDARISALAHLLDELGGEDRQALAGVLASLARSSTRGADAEDS